MCHFGLGVQELQGRLKKAILEYVILRGTQFPRVVKRAVRGHDHGRAWRGQGSSSRSAPSPASSRRCMGRCACARACCGRCCACSARARRPGRAAAAYTCSATVAAAVLCCTACGWLASALMSCELLLVHSSRAGAAGAAHKRENREWPVDGVSLSPFVSGGASCVCGLVCGADRLCAAYDARVFQYFWHV